MIFNNNGFKLNILISNDDGYQSKGIKLLSQVVSKFANVLVCAPDENMSGSSNCITLNRALKLNKSENGFYHVNGTPADCVKLALSIVDIKPDFIFSGINHGSNLADDTLYSGTIGAAIQGYLSNIPSIAFSLNDKSDKYWNTAYEVISSFMEFFIFNEKFFRNLYLLNINIPNIASIDIKGFKVAKLGRREQINNVDIETDSKGNNIYWVGSSGKPLILDDCTDFNAIAQGYVSITPLMFDLTSHKEIDIIKDVFKNFKFK